MAVQTEMWYPQGTVSGFTEAMQLTVAMSDFTELALQYRLHLFMVPPMCLVIVTFDVQLPYADIRAQVCSWIDHIRAHQPSCQIALLGTKADLVNKATANAVAECLSRELKVPADVVNAKSSKGLKHASEFVLHRVLECPSLELLIPRTVTLLDQSIENDAPFFSLSPVMPWSQWHKYCEQRSVTEMASLVDTTRYLEQSGSISWVQTTPSQTDHSADWIVLSREWLLDRMLKLPLLEAVTSGDRINTIALTSADEQTDMAEWHRLHPSLQSALYDFVATFISTTTTTKPSTISSSST